MKQTHLPPWTIISSGSRPTDKAESIDPLFGERGDHEPLELRTLWSRKFDTRQLINYLTHRIPEILISYKRKDRGGGGLL